jgi:hypothetical protein
VGGERASAGLQGTWRHRKWSAWNGGGRGGVMGSDDGLFIEQAPAVDDPLRLTNAAMRHGRGRCGCA